MTLQKNYVVATISNKFTSAIGQVITDEAFIENGKTVSLSEFKLNVVELIKNKYLDLCILDATYLKNISDLPEAVKYLVANCEGMRIIVLAPNLEDDHIIAKLVSYGVFDILTPKINFKKESKLAIDKRLVEELEFSLMNPKNFGQMVKYLDTATDSEETAAVVKKDKKQKTVANAKRTYILYRSEKFKSIVDALYKDLELSIVTSKKFDNSDLSDIKLLNLDYLFLDSPTEEELNNILNIVLVIDNTIKVFSAYSDIEEYKKVANRTDIFSFVYDGVEDFERKIYNTLDAKEEAKEAVILETSSKVITVVSAKGGNGGTTVSTLIADTFAKEKQLGLKVALVDFRPTSGTLNVRYRIYEPKQNIYGLLADVIKNHKMMYNMEYMRGQVVNYMNYIKEDNVYILPNTYEDWFEFTEYQYPDSELNYALQYTIDSLKKYFDIIILDTDIHSSAFDVAVLNSSHVFVVSELDVASLYQLKSVLRRLNPSIFPNMEDKVAVVINKSRKGSSEIQYDNSKMIKDMFTGQTFYLDYDKKVAEAEERLYPITCSTKLKEQVRGVCGRILPVIKSKR